MEWEEEAVRDLVMGHQVDMAAIGAVLPCVVVGQIAADGRPAGEQVLEGTVIQD